MPGILSEIRKLYPWSRTGDYISKDQPSINKTGRYKKESIKILEIENIKQKLSLKILKYWEFTKSEITAALRTEDAI